MERQSAQEIYIRRIGMAGIGAAAGLAAFALIDIAPSALQNDRTILFLSVLALVGFGATLLATGPISPGRAAIGSWGLALLVALLMFWASHRFDTVEAFAETGHPLVAAALLSFIPMPFWIAISRPDARWNDYEVLFDESWRIVVRGLISALFTGVFWAIVVLSDLLLEVVGISWIGDLISRNVVQYVLTGLVFGVCLAVVHEFAATISPYLPLRLFRLILPVVVAVSALFLVALGLRGASGLFDELSPAATMMLVALLGIALIAIAIDRRDDLAVGPGLLRWSSRAMSLFALCLGTLSIYAILVRTVDYGWTPDRLAAMTAAVVVTGYGAVYTGLAALPARHWMAWTRMANVALAILVALVAMLWLTPVLHPQRISADNQIARLVSEEVTADELDLWTIRSEFGRAGATMLRDLAGLDHPQADVIADRLAALDAQTGPEVTEAVPPAAKDDLARQIRDMMPVFPQGTVLDPAFLSAVETSDLQRWRDGCNSRSDGGHPGCLAVVSDLDPSSGATEVVVFYLQSGFVQISARDGLTARPKSLAGNLASFTSPDMIDRIHAGELSINPVSLRAIGLGGVNLFVLP